MTQTNITIQGITVAPGEQATVELPIASLYAHARMTIPVQVVCGKHPGPCLFISAAIHGDEINGVEIIRRLLRSSLLKRLRGTLLAIPIVNVYGFVSRSRYLPDRRDLNRSFPGSEKGSLAARMADLFLEEIVAQSHYGIDLHSGAIHRENLPHIRVNLEDKRAARLARVFNVPVILNADLRDGSLREEAASRGIPMLLYEAGEALRFDERSIRCGLKGIVSVMQELEMLPRGTWIRRDPQPVVARTSTWVRAEDSGILLVTTPLGARVTKGDTLGFITGAFGEDEIPVLAPAGGIIIGRTNLPLVNEGEALFHIARFHSPREAEIAVEGFQSPVPLEPAMTQAPPII